MYKPTIGLEIHAELNTKSKMFCSCKNDPSEKRPNFNICPICAGHPGTLPVANEEAIKKVIKTGLALNCEVSETSKFDRKNYFYPDLPKGYQISQYDEPLCEKGYLEIKSEIPNPLDPQGHPRRVASETNSKFQIKNSKRIRITRIHLEEDTGSLLHPNGADPSTSLRAGYSLVNLNRAGVPLMELVTEPDITSGVEAREFAQELQLILRYLDVSDADMEKGLMRVEVNISLSKNNELGTKVEIKNLNSFRVVEKAIDFEIERQKEILEAGDKVIQETRGWDDKREITFSQREKEEAHDYRYFPEPDLLPLHFSEDYINGIKSDIPELPEQKRKRFAKEYGLPEEPIEIFVGNKELSAYFEKAASELAQWISVEETASSSLRGEIPRYARDRLCNLYKLLANYLTSDVMGILAGKTFNEKDFNITPENFAEFIKMIYKNEISSKIAKMLLPEMLKTGEDPSVLVEQRGWRQISDDSELENIVKKIIENNPKAVADYKKGNTNALQFLAGQVMKETRGTANPQKVRQALDKDLSF